MQHFGLMKKTIVITGGSRGIGNSIAHKFVKNNYNIITCSRSKNNLSELTKQLKKINSKIKIYTIDVDLSIKNDCIKFCEFVKSKTITPFFLLRVDDYLYRFRLIRFDRYLY